MLKPKNPPLLLHIFPLSYMSVYCEYLISGGGGLTLEVWVTDRSGDLQSVVRKRKSYEL